MRHTWLTAVFFPASASVLRVERVLAVGRAAITAIGFTAVVIHPSQPAQLAAVIDALIGAYVLYSIGMLLYVWRAARVWPAYGMTLHGLDILWAAGLTGMSGGPLSPLFLLFLFAVMAAAYRWGLSGTITTTVIVMSIFLVETAMVTAVPWNPSGTVLAGAALSQVITRASYLLLTAFLLGYLGEQGKRLREELAAIAEVAREPNMELGLGTRITAVAHALMRTFESSAVVAVIEDTNTGDASLWHVTWDTMNDHADSARHELSAEERATWFFPDPGRAWDGVRRHGDGTCRTRALVPGGWRLRRADAILPPAIAARDWERIAVANFGLSGEWRGRVYLVAPASTGGIEQMLYLLDGLMEHATPALSTVLLLGRLRAQVTAAERAHVARELHDGAIQSLIGVEMEVEALRRRSSDAWTAAELQRITELLRGQVLELRELMQALQPVILDAGDDLPDVLAHLVERFRRDTGISARFMCIGRSPALPRARALELVRIVQEALANVRRHSRARNVLVRLDTTDARAVLVIEDDGIGFGFSGALSAAELQNRRTGPAMIKERARIANAALMVESTPGAGARISLTMDTVA